MLGELRASVGDIRLRDGRLRLGDGIDGEPRVSDGTLRPGIEGELTLRLRRDGELKLRLIEVKSRLGTARLMLKLVEGSVSELKLGRLVFKEIEVLGSDNVGRLLRETDGTPMLGIKLEMPVSIDIDVLGSDSDRDRDGSPVRLVGTDMLGTDKLGIPVLIEGKLVGSDIGGVSEGTLGTSRLGKLVGSESDGVLSAGILGTPGIEGVDKDGRLMTDGIPGGPTVQLPV